MTVPRLAIPQKRRRYTKHVYQQNNVHVLHERSGYIEVAEPSNQKGKEEEPGAHH